MVARIALATKNLNSPAYVPGCVFWMVKKMNIIDSHVHVGLADFCEDKTADIARVLCNTHEDTIALMDRYGIAKSVLLPIPHRDIDTKRTNAYVYEGFYKFPNRFIPFCRIDDMLEQNLTSGFQGVKLHLLYEDVKISQIKKQLHIIEDFGVPLIIHALFKDKIKQIEQILSIAPNIKIILAHMGRGQLYTGEQTVENAIGLKKYPNVYFETSTVGDICSMINVCEILGYERIIYGSDYPFGEKFLKKDYDYTKELKMLSDELTVGQADLVFHKNIENLLSSKTVRVRRVKKGDLFEIVALFEQLSEIDKKFLALSQKYSLIKQVIKSERHCYVAVKNNKIVGFIRESGRPEGYSLLEEIVVSPEYRGHGIAQILLKYYHNIFSKNLAKTNKNNSAIIHLLQKNGYKPVNPDSSRIIDWRKNAD